MLPQIRCSKSPPFIHHYKNTLTFFSFILLCFTRSIIIFFSSQDLFLISHHCRTSESSSSIRCLHFDELDTSTFFSEDYIRIKGFLETIKNNWHGDCKCCCSRVFRKRYFYNQNFIYILKFNFVFVLSVSIFDLDFETCYIMMGFVTMIYISV